MTKQLLYKDKNLWRCINWPQRGEGLILCSYIKKREKKHRIQAFVSVTTCIVLGFFPGYSNSPGLGEKIDSCMNIEGICQVRENRRVELKMLPRTVK